MNNNNSDFSLLYPNGVNQNKSDNLIHIKQLLWKDLSLDIMIEMFKLNKREVGYVKEILLELNTDIETIKYRQDILEDFLNNEKIVLELSEIIPNIEIMIEHQQRFQMKRDEVLYDAVSKLNELETYVNVMSKLSNLFSNSNSLYKSEGISRLRNIVEEVTSTDEFKKLVIEIPKLIDIRQNMRSISVGINLNKSLDPIEATLLSINKDEYKGSNLLKRVFGKEENGKEGIAKLHVKPLKREYDISTPFSSFLNLDGDNTSTVFLDMFFNDLALLMKDVSKPIVNVIKKYININSSILVKLYYELVFYIGSVKMLKELKGKGFSLCKPEIIPIEERVIEAKESYNINLAKVIVEKDKVAKLTTNDINFNNNGRVLILTGPNSGGKTTYIESIGIIQILTQAGLFIPAESAKISPVDNIFTHYQVEEETNKEAGRLGQESKRFKEIFEHITKYSLVIMNESFSSTSEIDSYYIAKDIVSFFKQIGNKVIYATHIYELANNVEEINAETKSESKIKNIVATVYKNNETNRMEPTYKIVEGEPLGRSFATEVVEDYGISYNQIEALLKKREVI